ncbi:SDR family oxidoreductase [Pseudonocardia humida]|uniref:SDR family oxidoreductase n=1 Tax=Pseudonocardia humida TaxID=2800819 RepID=A0ABT0ZWA5_9PSEU|nr:SDR family oxidoreductase [Pseudonocardia humida]MCO1655029.1 SDR family oxidoreductase [Pseudonocardia humida]
MRAPVAIVTGVGRRVGIGTAIARRLAADGVDLLIQSWPAHDAGQPWGADPGWPAPLFEELRAGGRSVVHVEADFADPDAPRRVVAAAVERFGGVDVLVANHARSSDQDLEQLTAAEIDLSFAVNTRATLLLVKEFAARHGGTHPGRVVMMTSGQHRGPMPGELPYIASKGALHQLTASLAAHLAPRGITVNTVNPGATDTGWADPAVHRAVLDVEPMGRWGTPEDAARLIGWLVGPDAGWVTGEVINSTGGGP